MLFVGRMDEQGTNRATAHRGRSVYGGRVAERLRSPFGVGHIDGPTAVGEAGAAECRGLIRVELRLEGETITDARFQAYGCPATIACASEAVGFAKGATMLEAASVTADQIASSLELAPGKKASADLAIEALHGALTDLVARSELPGSSHVLDEKGVLVGMSGGVDSAVAALLLKRQGFRVVGATLRLWTDPGADTQASCCSPENVRLARRVAHGLGIPHLTVDAVDEFREEVVEYFVAEYAAGRTPNPCAKCNARLRFSLLGGVARRLGLGWVATGHYARQAGEPPGLSRGIDSTKDQSYALAEVSPALLAHCLFPLGGLRKADVRKLAADEGIEGSGRPESQEICFIPDDDYRRFLRVRLGERPGPIVDAAGKVLGRHIGTYNYTIGQRKGLGIAAAEPLFVTGLDAEKAEVLVGVGEELDVDEVLVEGISWHGDLLPGGGFVQFRSSGGAVPTLPPSWEGQSAGDAGSRHHGARAAPTRVTMTLVQPARGVARGQTAVFYQGDRVAFAGTIVATKRSEHPAGTGECEKAVKGPMV